MAFYDKVQSRVLALPGVEGMSMSTHITLKGGSGVSAVSVEGTPPADPKKFNLDTEQQSVTDGYFRFMGIPLQRGREFQWTDRGQAAPVAVVNKAMVRKSFSHEDPLGKHIQFPGPEDANPWLTIVGVVGDEKQSTPFQEMAWAEPPIVYRPLAQQEASTVDLAVRVASVQTPSGGGSRLVWRALSIGGPAHA